MKDLEREKRDKNLQSRRDFFKRVSTRTLPFLGAVVLGPAISLTTLTSCGCDGCEAACMDNCEGSCFGSCRESATGSTCSDCSSSCSGSSTSNSCSNCANDCSSSCKETCKETCKNTCTNTCEGSAQGKPTTGMIDGHEYVDLGLSVLWATCNVGATVQDGFGDYYAFADTSGNIKDLDNIAKDYYKSLNLKAGDSISGTHLDVAKYKWGSKWRLPSKDEIEELINNCNLEEYHIKDYYYCAKFVSKINGNSIIIPYPGEYTRIDQYYLDYERGFYWSGDVIEGGPIPSAAILDVYDKRDYPYEPFAWVQDGWADSRYSVRPVSNRANGNVSTCNGSCTANCSSDCTSSCKGECKTSCVGGCGNNCTGGCKGKCTRTCADNCSSDCTGKCTRTCADNCYSNCYSGCTTTCADACKAQTSQGCSNCSSDCSSSCGSSCETNCTGNCGMQCAETCGGNCSRDCIGQCSRECRGGSYANASWCASCVYGCDSYCANTCSFYCYSSCQNNGRKG